LPQRQVVVREVDLGRQAAVVDLVLFRTLVAPVHPVMVVVPLPVVLADLGLVRRQRKRCLLLQ